MKTAAYTVSRTDPVTVTVAGSELSGSGRHDKVSTFFVGKPDILNLAS
jgi:hypothetical protein